MSLEFNVCLQLSDFKAEEITDSSIWIKKSHEPKPNLNNKTNKCNKILCCVRNPYDCISSLMHFLPTLNQEGQINEKFSQIPEVWDKLVKEATDSQERYYRELSEVKEVPIYYIRYEDLYVNPQKTLEEVFCFLLDLETIEGLNIQKRIKEVVGMGH